MDCNIVKFTNKIRHCSFAVSILMVAVFYCPILSQGLVDFVIGLVNTVLNLPDGLLKVLFWGGRGGGGIQMQKNGNQSWSSKLFLRLFEMTFGLVRTSSSLPEW